MLLEVLLKACLEMKNHGKKGTQGADFTGQMSLLDSCEMHNQSDSHKNKRKRGDLFRSILKNCFQEQKLSHFS